VDGWTGGLVNRWTAGAFQPWLWFRVLSDAKKERRRCARRRLSYRSTGLPVYRFAELFRAVVVLGFFVTFFFEW
jgi:hypothetical protein